MAFIFYNLNPSGNLVGDCVIRGISKIEKASWEDIYMAVSLRGFMLHDMPSSNAVWGSYLRSRDYNRYSIPNTCPDCYTVKDFASEHPNGRYLLAT